jgi:GT2 family glycosyltransferase
MSRFAAAERLPSEASIALPLSLQPDVSIVVLAWRLTRELQDCLSSLAASMEAPAFETIVVLNGAEDEVRDAVGSMRGVRTVDIPVNVGYGDGCNAGAGIARGRHLLLLNDDVAVHPEWLRTLVDAGDRDPRIGAVGSLLLALDGTVQEVGSRLGADGHPRPSGQHLTVKVAGARGLLAARDVDFASGAALLIRRSAFEAVGGFDPAFRPAYYEDADLCLRLRQASWRVTVEPAARVSHVGGGSTVRDPHFRDFAITHARAVFLSRWPKTLAAAPSARAAVGTLCDPALDAVPYRPDRGPESPERIALEIAWSYQAWIAERLDRLAELERVALPRLESLEHEIADIRRRGPLGLLRWRVGSWRRDRSLLRTATTEGIR